MMLKLDRLFQSGMVLQCEKPVSIWGTAMPGADVSVSIQGKTVSVQAKADGSWLVWLDPLSASFQEVLIVASGNETIITQDVQVGEVWLAGGQSNMEFHMRYDTDFASEQAQCSNDAIRFFDYPEVSYVGQINEADYSKHYAFWRKATPQDLERFSAVGYYFAKELYKKYRIPIGIIGCNWGGSPACAWMSESSIRLGGGQLYLDEYAEAIDGLDFKEYDHKFFSGPGAYKLDLLADPVSDMMMRGCTVEEITSALAKSSLDAAKIVENTQVQMGPRYERRPSGLYNSMLRPLVPYSIRGVIWYQGETDGDCHPELYQTLFPALIADWRNLWDDELPFLFVQLAPLEQWMQCAGKPYAVIRMAQQHTADTVPMTGMAVTSDVGMQYDIHPKKKQPVGYRLALLAEKKVYGENVLCEAPTLADVLLSDGQLTLRFENVGDGLYLSERSPYGNQLPARQFSGIEIEQDGATVDLGSLNVTVRNDIVTFTGEVIHSNKRTTVRIAQGGWYQVNLYNSANLPARPASLEIVNSSHTDMDFS